jgi:hypothetical protein
MLLLDVFRTLALQNHDFLVEHLLQLVSNLLFVLLQCSNFSVKLLYYIFVLVLDFILSLLLDSCLEVGCLVDRLLCLWLYDPDSYIFLFPE